MSCCTTLLMQYSKWYNCQRLLLANLCHVALLHAASSNQLNRIQLFASAILHYIAKVLCCQGDALPRCCVAEVLCCQGILCCQGDVLLRCCMAKVLRCRGVVLSRCCVADQDIMLLRYFVLSRCCVANLLHCQGIELCVKQPI